MSHVHQGPLAGYNSLTDSHLAGYFANGRMRRHLRKAGLVSRSGEIVSESTYRLNMSRREHKQHVKDMLAQAIVHKTLDMERSRQAEIKKKLEEIAKIQLVRRVKASTSRKGDEDVLPLLTPRSGSEQASPEPSPRAKRSKKSPSRRVKTGSRKGGCEADGAVLYIDDEGRPITPSNFGEQKKRQTSARSNIDGRHLHSLDSVALRKYAMLMSQMDVGSGLTSPYMMPQMPLPPRPPSSARSSRSMRRAQSATPRRNVTTDARLAKLHRPETAKSHAGDNQTLCKVTLKYHGWALNLARERVDTTQEVIVEQQHCGGNTLTVFKDRLDPGTKFQFISYRHRGYPFSLSLYVDGQMDSRVSTCCEYRHSKGAKLGGAQGHFSLLAVSGAVPCYKCQVVKGVNQHHKAPPRKLKRPADVRKEEVEVTGTRGKKEEEGEEDKEEEDAYAEEGFEDDDEYADDFDDSQTSEKSKDSSSSASSSSSDSESESSKEEKKKKKKKRATKVEVDDDSDNEDSADGRKDEEVRYERKMERGNRETDEEKEEEKDKEEEEEEEEEEERRASPRVRGSERRSPRVEVNGTGREIDDYSSDEDGDKKTKVISVEDEDADRESATKIRSRRRSSSSSSPSPSSRESSPSANEDARKSKKRASVDEGERKTAVVSVERLNAEEKKEEEARAERERRNAKRVREEEELAREREKEKEKKRKKKQEEEEEKEEARRKREEQRQELLQRQQQRDEERREREEQRRQEEERRRMEREEEEERRRRRAEEEDADPETRERKRLLAQRERDERIRREQEERERKMREQEKEREEKWRQQETHREEKRKRAAEERRRRREEEESGAGSSSYRSEDDSTLSYSTTASAVSSAANTPRHQPSKQPIPELKLPDGDNDNVADESDLTPRPASPLPPAAIYEHRRDRRQDNNNNDDRPEDERERAVSPFPDAAVYDPDWRKSRKQQRQLQFNEPDVAQERSVSPFPEAAVYEPRPKRQRQEESKKPQEESSSSQDDDDDDDDNRSDASQVSLEHVHEARQTYSKEAPGASDGSEGEDRTEKKDSGSRNQTAKSKRRESYSSEEETEEDEEESEDVTSSTPTTPRAQQAGGGVDKRGEEEGTGTADSSSDSETTSGSDDEEEEEEEEETKGKVKAKSETETEKGQKGWTQIQKGGDHPDIGIPPTTTTTTSESDGENMHGGADPDNVAEQEEGEELHPLKTKARPAAKAHKGEITDLIKEGNDSVDLSNVLLNKTQVYQLASQLEGSAQLKTVTLCNTGLDDNDIQRLTDALIASPSQPVMLNLSQNAVRKDGVSHILHLLKAKPTIKVLILQGNPLGDEGIEVLATGLQDIHRQARIARKAAVAAETDDTTSITSNTSSIDPSVLAQRYILQELDLTDTGLGDGGASHLSTVIAGNVYLEHVNLSQNPSITSAEGWRKIGEALARNRCIRSLTLDGSRLGNEGVAHIAQGLSSNRILRSLGLEDARIGEDGGKSLVNMLKKNTSILELTLSPGNSVPLQLANEIAKYVALNRTPFNI